MTNKIRNAKEVLENTVSINVETPDSLIQAIQEMATEIQTPDMIQSTIDSTIADKVSNAIKSSKDHAIVLKDAGTYALAYAVTYGNCDHLQTLLDGVQNQDKLAFIAFLKNANKAFKTPIVGIKMDGKRPLIHLSKGKAESETRKELRMAYDTVDSLADKFTDIAWVTEKNVTDSVADFNQSAKSSIKTLIGKYAVDKANIKYVALALNNFIEVEPYTEHEIDSLIVKAQKRILIERESSKAA